MAQDADASRAHPSSPMPSSIHCHWTMAGDVELESGVVVAVMVNGMVFLMLKFQHVT